MHLSIRSHRLAFPWAFGLVGRAIQRIGEGLALENCEMLSVTRLQKIDSRRGRWRVQVVVKHDVVDQPRPAEHDCTAQDGPSTGLDDGVAVKVEQLVRVVHSNVEELDFDAPAVLSRVPFHLVDVFFCNPEHVSNSYLTLLAIASLPLPLSLCRFQRVDEDGRILAFVLGEVGVPRTEREVRALVAIGGEDDEVVREREGDVQVEEHAAEQEGLLDVFLAEVGARRLCVRGAWVKGAHLCRKEEKAKPT